MTYFHFDDWRELQARASLRNFWLILNAARLELIIFQPEIGNLRELLRYYLTMH